MMKNYLMSILFATTTLIYISCNAENCAEKEYSLEGKCVCLDGYSGFNCELEDLCITSNSNPCINGDCDNNQCNCDLFWEGPKCDLAVLRRYEGLYQISVIGDEKKQFEIEPVQMMFRKNTDETFGERFHYLNGLPLGKEISKHDGWVNIKFNEDYNIHRFTMRYKIENTDRTHFVSSSSHSTEYGDTIEFNGYGLISERQQDCFGNSTLASFSNLTIRLYKIGPGDATNY